MISGLKRELGRLSVLPKAESGVLVLRRGRGSAFSHRAWCLPGAPRSAGGWSPGWTARVCVAAGTAPFPLRQEGGFVREIGHVARGALSKQNGFRKEFVLQGKEVDVALLRAAPVQEPRDVVGAPSGYSFTLMLAASGHCFLALDKSREGGEVCLSNDVVSRCHECILICSLPDFESFRVLPPW